MKSACRVYGVNMTRNVKFEILRDYNEILVKRFPHHLHLFHSEGGQWIAFTRLKAAGHSRTTTSIRISKSIIATFYILISRKHGPINAVTVKSIELVLYTLSITIQWRFLWYWYAALGLTLPCSNGSARAFIISCSASIHFNELAVRHVSILWDHRILRQYYWDDRMRERVRSKQKPSRTNPNLRAVSK